MQRKKKSSIASENLYSWGQKKQYKVVTDYFSLINLLLQSINYFMSFKWTEHWGCLNNTSSYNYFLFYILSQDVLQRLSKVGK